MDILRLYPPCKQKTNPNKFLKNHRNQIRTDDRADMNVFTLYPLRWELGFRKVREK